MMDPAYEGLHVKLWTGWLRPRQREGRSDTNRQAALVLDCSSPFRGPIWYIYYIRGGYEARPV